MHTLLQPVADLAVGVPRRGLYRGANQPARRCFGITDVSVDGEPVPVRTSDVAATPFCVLTEFAREDTPALRDVLVVAPLSGHFSFLLRDFVVGLVPFFRVYVTDWVNPRHVDAAHGTFGLDDNISCVVETTRRLAPGLSVIGLCQGGVPALCATTRLAAADDPRTPSTLVLMATPIDPLVSPTRIVRLLRSQSLSWFEDNLIATVPEAYAGRGRRVYPASLRLAALTAYLTRQASEGSDMSAKVFHDDGTDPWHFPFLDLYTSIMDLDAEFLLSNTKAVYQDCALREGTFFYDGERIDLRAIGRTALMTVEGEWDDIAAPGQTSAAHDLCASLAPRQRRQIMVPRSGHFSLFYGEICRREVLPAVRDFCGGRDQSGCSPQ